MPRLPNAVRSSGRADRPTPGWIILISRGWARPPPAEVLCKQTEVALQIEIAMPDGTPPAISPSLSLRRRAVGVLQLSIHRSEEHTSELQSLMRISYAVLCLKTKKIK